MALTLPDFPASTVTLSVELRSNSLGFDLPLNIPPEYVNTATDAEFAAAITALADAFQTLDPGGDLSHEIHWQSSTGAGSDTLTQDYGTTNT